MTFPELITKVRKYQYLEDTGAIKVAIAGMVATRMRLGAPVWMILIGASSGGKSQILRPLALTDDKFIHRVDDLTENTFLSGFKAAKGAKSPSLLHRIGSFGMIVISDFTVIFSKNRESKGAILSQIRMIYDGEMVKYSGTSGDAITWKGSLGVLAGATPTVYENFEEVADMGQRFIYYRMQDYDEKSAIKLALSRKKNGEDLDKELSEHYSEYIKQVVEDWITGSKEIVLPQDIEDRIIRISMFAEKVRTPITMDFQKKDITKKPVPAYATRAALQIESIAKGLVVMGYGELEEEDIRALDRCAWSLANEEKRGVLKILAELAEDSALSTQGIADKLGLSTSVTGHILQNLAAVGVVVRSGTGEGLRWQFAREDDRKLVREIEGIVEDVSHADRALSTEDGDEMDDVTDHAFNMFGK